MKEFATLFSHLRCFLFLFFLKSRNLCTSVIALISISSLSQTIQVLPENANWTFYYQQNPPSEDWKNPGFVDNSWSQSHAIFGYGIPNAQTHLNFGPDSENKFPTAYFRKQIHLNGAATLSNTLLRIKRDDGIVLYVNGVERYRNNMPTGAITHSTPASNLAGNNGSDWIYYNLPNGIFTEGNNTIAAEVHQYSASDPDLAFDCSILGTQTDIVSPIITTYYPAQESVNVSPEALVSISFNEPIHALPGFVHLKHGGAIIESLSTTSEAVSISGNTVQFLFTILPSGTPLSVEIPQGIFTDYVGNSYENSIQWNFATSCASIACFESVHPAPQDSVLQIPESHTFHVIFQTGDTLSSGIFPDNPDFTGYISAQGAYEGYLCINHENAPLGGVLVARVDFNDSLKLWQHESATEVDFSDLGGTMRNCSGAITPWGTMLSGEEVRYAASDNNSDGYYDSGWLVEIIPESAQICSYNTNTPQKLWAVGRMAHENASVSARDSKTVYFGEDDPAGCLYKFVADEAGNLSSGNLFVLKLDSTLLSGEPTSNTGYWLAVPNTTTEHCNYTFQLATMLGGTVFNGIEDVELGPDGRVYFASKNFGRIYRFKDTDFGVSNFEVYAGGTSYAITTSDSIVMENWGLGNDNLAFDGDGNLWVLQDGGRNHIWLVRNGHTQLNPRVELFAKTPAGSEPTGITFSKDYRYMFISFQHPDSTNGAQQDASGRSIKLNRGSVIAVARKEHLGNNANSLGNADPQKSASMVVYPNPSKGQLTLALQLSKAQKIELDVLAMDGSVLYHDTFYAGAGKSNIPLEILRMQASQLIRVKGEHFIETIKLIGIN